MNGTGTNLLSDEILNSVSEAVIAADARGRIAFINSEAIRLFGFHDRSELVGRPVKDVFRRDGDETIRRLLAGEIEGKQTLWLERRDLKCEIEFEASASRIIDADGSLRGVVGVFADLSLRRRAESAERRVRRLEGIRQIAATLAHEIRNPLACISGSIQALHDTLVVTGDERELLEITQSECERLNETITQFLDFARPTKLAPSDVDLAESLREVHSLLSRRPGARAEAIVLRIPSALRCHADPRQVKQVFLNLGLNALEAMPAGGTLTIRAFECADSRSGVEIEFIDEGCGISEEVRSRLFEPFFTTKARGTGLGLAVARQIMEAHGGTISAEPNTGRGTTFRLWLPRNITACPHPPEVALSV